MKALTDAAVRKAKAGTNLSDGACPGLRIAANAKVSGRGAWFYRYKAQNKLKQVKLGDYPGMGLAEARARWDELRNLKSQGVDPQAFVKDQKAAAVREAKVGEAEVLLGELWSAYKKGHLNGLKRGHEQIRVVEFDLPPGWYDRTAKEIQHREAKLLAKEVMARSAEVGRQFTSTLRSMYDWAEDQPRFMRVGVLPDSNPFQGIRPPKANRRTRNLSDGEIKQWLGWLERSCLSRTVRDVLKIMLLTGCRGDEVVSMRWSDLDDDLAEWRVPSTKNKLEHVVYLADWPLKIARDRRELTEGSEFVFPVPGRPERHIRENALNVGLATARKRDDTGKLDHWTPHDLRRSCGTGLARLGCPQEVQNRCLNHVRTSGVEAIYNRHSYDLEARVWWGKWADHVRGLNQSNVIPLDRESRA